MSTDLTLESASGTLAEAAGDAIILPLFLGAALSANAAAVDERLGGLLRQMQERREFRGDANEVVVLPTLGNLPALRIALVGLGKRSDFRPHLALQATASTARALGRRGLRTAAIDTADFPLPAEDAASLIAEGAQFARFSVGVYRTGETRDTNLHGLAVYGAADSDLRRGAIRGRAKNWARELVNEPSNILDPPELAARSLAMAEEVGLQCRVMDEAAMEQAEMTAILTVSRGSEVSGRFIVLEHRKGGDGPLLALVGKAVCFDTGGISIKPSAEMGRMKGDMAGGAAVLGAMRAIAELDLPVNVIGLVPAVLNMPDGRAWRPGDVVRTKGGKTVETITTDAEGRMLLADGVAYARELGATHIVDIATLTGAVGVALGHFASGLFGTDDALIQAVRECGEDAGERHWPMPLFPEYKELIRSDIADLKNSGGRHAGAITGAYFVREFAGDTPWVHLDIAGSATNEKARPYAPVGPLGTGVGTFVNLAMRLGEI